MGYVHLSGKLDRVSANDIIKRVKENTGEDYYDQPEWYRKGLLLKKRVVVKEMLNPYSGENVTVERSEVINATKLLDGHTSENIEFLIAPQLPIEGFSDCEAIPEDYDYSRISKLI